MVLHGCGCIQFETGNTQVHFPLSLVLHSSLSYQNEDRYLKKGNSSPTNTLHNSGGMEMGRGVELSFESCQVLLPLHRRIK